MKKIISLLLVTLLLVSTLPGFASGTDAANDYKMILSFGKAEDVSVLNHVWGSTPLTSENANSDYTKLSKYSAHWSTKAGQYFNWKEQNIDITDYKYINFWIYSDKALSVYATMTVSSYGSTLATVLSAAQGWNLVSAALNSNDAAHHNFKVPSYSTAIKSIAFSTDRGNTIPEGCSNAGTKISDQSGAKSTNWYIDSIFLSKNAPAAPVVTPSIQNGVSDVDCDTTEYVLTFDSEMNTSTLTTDNIKVKETVSGTEVTPLSITPSGKAATLKFAEGSFAAGVGYTVTVSNAVESAFGLSVGGDVAYSFTTRESTAIPVANMTAPAGSATVAKDNAVLTATVSNNEAVNKVEFYEEAGETDTLLGSGVKGENNTYSLNYSSFAVGNHTVYAIVTYNNYESTITTVPVTFNVVEIPEYAIAGINNNKIDFYANYFCENTIGLNTTEYVSKVTYFVDDTEKAVVTDAPFTYDLEVADFDNHSVRAEVVDVLGGVHNLTAVPYSVGFLTAGDAVWTDDYDNSETGLTKVNERATISYVDDPAMGGNRKGKVAYIEYNANDGKPSCFVKSLPISGSKKVRIDLDMYLTNETQKNIYMDIRPHQQYYTGIQGYLVGSYSKNFKMNEWNNVSVLIDFSQSDKTAFKTYVNGIQIIDTVTNGTEFHRTNNSVIHLMGLTSYYVDNLKVYNYSDAALEEPAVGRAYFESNDNGWVGNVVVASKAHEDKECTIIRAVYDSENTLISAESEPVTIPAGKIINKEYTVNKVHDGQTGTKMRAFIWESVNGEMTLRPLDTLN